MPRRTAASSTDEPVGSSAHDTCNSGVCNNAGTGETPQPSSSPRSGSERAPSPGASDAEGEIDRELESIEQELRRDVPDFLETMNRTSQELLVFQGQADDAQRTYQQLLDRWRRKYEQLRQRYGTSIDRAKPYFDILQTLTTSKRDVQGAAREFSSAASQHTQAKAELRAIEERMAYGAHKVALDGGQQDDLSRATVRVLRCQQERDQREQDYARALRAYQESEQAAESWRTQIGESTIRRALPCFKKLQQHQLTLTAEQSRVNQLLEKVRVTKSGYNHSVRELERISNSVHDARRSHAANAAARGEEKVSHAAGQGKERASEPAA